MGRGKSRMSKDLNLGGCWRRRTHFWEGKACQKMELGSDSLEKVSWKKPEVVDTVKVTSLRRVRLTDALGA